MVMLVMCVVEVLPCKRVCMWMSINVNVSESIKKQGVGDVDVR